MREIAAKRRMEVLRLFFEGLSYEEVAERTNVSKGSVVNIIAEFRKGHYLGFESVLDVVDELRDLAVKINKTGIGVLQANLGLRFFEKLKTLGVEPQTLGGYIKMCSRISPPEFSIDKFVDAATKLVKLEETTGKSYEESLKELERARAKLSQITLEVRDLESRRASIGKQIADFESKESFIRDKLVGLTKGKEDLEKLGVDRVAKLALLIDCYEALGCEPAQVKELVNLRMWLIGIGLKPSELIQHIKDRKMLEQKVAKLRAQARSLEKTVLMFERYAVKLRMRSEALQVADEVLRSRTTWIACRRCGTTLLVHVPYRVQLEDSMRRGLIYPTRCLYCGYTAQIDPREILESIGWSLLA